MPCHLCVSRVLAQGLANNRCLIKVCYTKGWPLTYNYPSTDCLFQFASGNVQFDMQVVTKKLRDTPIGTFYNTQTKLRSSHKMSDRRQSREKQRVDIAVMSALSF